MGESDFLEPGSSDESAVGAAPAAPGAGVAAPVEKEMDNISTPYKLRDPGPQKHFDN